MVLAMKLTRENRRRIRKNIKKSDAKVETDALDEWASEGGAVANEPKIDNHKIVLIKPIRHLRDFAKKM